MNKCVQKQYNGATIECGHQYMGSGVVGHSKSPIGKMNTPLRKEFQLAKIKKIAT